MESLLFASLMLNLLLVIITTTKNSHTVSTLKQNDMINRSGKVVKVKRDTSGRFAKNVKR